jgi:hypothetical protein
VSAQPGQAIGLVVVLALFALIHFGTPRS